MPKGLRQTRPSSAYRWIKADTETWNKIVRYTKRLEQSGELYPFKLTANRVASMVFAEAVEKLPE